MKDYRDKNLSCGNGNCSRVTRKRFLFQAISISSILLLPSLILRRFKKFGRKSTLHAGNNVTSEKDSYGENADVFMVRNGDYTSSMKKLLKLLGGIEKYIDADDYVVIKGNAQWVRQGYTHTGCIKVLIDEILKIKNFTGEIYICDNVQDYGNVWARVAFNARRGKDRRHNWGEHNWTTLAEAYQKQGKPVAVKEWKNGGKEIRNGSEGVGWVREYFTMGNGIKAFLSYPVFESPLSRGTVIDMKHGVFKNGKNTGKRVKTIFMPTLNNHGRNREDFAGVTAAIKSFFGITEIPGGVSGEMKGYRNIHHATYTQGDAFSAGMLTARYIKDFIKPVLYVMPAIWAGYSRMGSAERTNVVLACRNPATLDYVACKEVISPHMPYLDPDKENNTRKQIAGCIKGGVGTMDPAKYKVHRYDFRKS